MVKALNVILYFVVSFQLVPYLVTFYYLYKARQVFTTVKLLWFLGFMFVTADAIFSYVQTNPSLFQTYYGSMITWILLSAGGA